jgi:hypothetical protein
MSIRAVGRTGPGKHLDPDAIRIEREERVVVLVVFYIVLRRWRLDLAMEGHASLIRFIDLVRVIDSNARCSIPALWYRYRPSSAGRRPKPCNPYSR